MTAETVPSEVRRRDLRHPGGGQNEDEGAGHQAGSGQARASLHDVQEGDLARGSRERHSPPPPRAGTTGFPPAPPPPRSSPHTGRRPERRRAQPAIFKGLFPVCPHVPSAARRRERPGRSGPAGPDPGRTAPGGWSLAADNSPTGPACAGSRRQRRRRRLISRLWDTCSRGPPGCSNLTNAPQ